MQHIDAILYINLAYRTDRNDHIKEECDKICKDITKIHRIDAIKHNEGALGCGLSHIKALKYAQSHPEWNTILILEDDFTFKDDDIENKLNHLFKTIPHFDVTLLSYNHDKIEYTNTSHESIKKVQYSQTTSSYIISRQYIPTLLQNMTESTSNMQLYGKQHKNCVDIYWTKLQPIGNWYALFPAIGYQYDNYSDIEKRITKYGC